MAMVKGNVAIDPDTGAATYDPPAGANLARELFDALEATISYGTISGTDLANARKNLANLCNTMALIVPHITTNAAVTSTVASDIACEVDAGTHEGATTETGTASGTVA